MHVCQFEIVIETTGTPSITEGYCLSCTVLLLELYLSCFIFPILELKQKGPILWLLSFFPSQDGVLIETTHLIYSLMIRRFPFSTHNLLWGDTQ